MLRGTVQKFEISTQADSLPNSAASKVYLETQANMSSIEIEGIVRQ